MSLQKKTSDLLMIVLSFSIISAGYAFSNAAWAAEAAPDTGTVTAKKDPTTQIEPTKAPTELIEGESGITKLDENSAKSSDKNSDKNSDKSLGKSSEKMPDEVLDKVLEASTKGSESQVTDVSDLTKAKPEAKEAVPEAAPTETEQNKPTLSERVQIFIPSEDIDTEKAVAFPTNI